MQILYWVVGMMFILMVILQEMEEAEEVEEPDVDIAKEEL